ncbi:MAG: hypothetical protein ACU0CO_14140, partial [Shimia sp.]
VVCIAGRTQIDVMVPIPIAPAQDGRDMRLHLRVDEAAPVALDGYVAAIDDASSAFVGRDRRDRPAAGTRAILEAVRAGTTLTMQTARTGPVLDTFDLVGGATALAEMERGCG